MGEVRSVDRQVGIIGIAFIAMGAGAITYREHSVEDLESQSRALGRPIFGGRGAGTSQRDQAEAASIDR